MRFEEEWTGMIGILVKLVYRLRGYVVIDTGYTLQSDESYKKLYVSKTGRVNLDGYRLHAGKLVVDGELRGPDG